MRSSCTCACSRVRRCRCASRTTWRSAATTAASPARRAGRAPTGPCSWPPFPAPSSASASRSAAFAIEPLDGTRFDRVGGDERLFEDGRSREQPFVCIDGVASPSFGLRLAAGLVPAQQAPEASTLPLPALRAPASSSAADDIAQLADILPWYAHDALVHYLAPRGLEQYSGGGWGTRDVCQGPLEMLLALGRHDAVRELLLRVFAAQNPDGDWPQWFMFFDRERDIRAPDSHGDIVFWPLLGLARYLDASGDAGLLDVRAALPRRARPPHCVDARGARARSDRRAAGRRHAPRGVRPRRLERRAAAGRPRAARTHVQRLDRDAAPRDAHRACARPAQCRRARRDADRLGEAATRVLDDFQRLLMPDGVVAGYALWRQPGQSGDRQPEAHLLHPRDAATGVRYSLLPMMHAVLADMLTPAQARQHAALMAEHLQGPDGARLFDRPLAYHGGLQRLFQRGESSSFFGREIGIMYTHAHLRHAQMLAHLGDARGLLDALRKAHPILVREHVPMRRAAPGQLLLQQLRRRIRRPLRGRPTLRRTRSPAACRSKAAGASTPAARASSSRSSCAASSACARRRARSRWTR